MNILVTGGSGFIGSFLVEKLIEKDYTVTILDSSPISTARNLENIKHSKKLNYIQGDVCDRKFIFDLFSKEFDYVYHLAAIVGIKHYIDNPLNVINVNILGTKNILEAASEKSVPVLLTSTSEIYGNNPSVPWPEDGDRVLGSTSIDRWSYSSSKAICEHMAFALFKNANLPVSIVRFFNVYGPRQDPILVVSQNIKRAVQGKLPILYDGGNQTRCFTYVEDAVEATIKVAESSNCRGEAFNVGSSFEYTIKSLLQEICKISGLKSGFEEVNTKEMYGDKYQDIVRRVPSVEKVKNYIGWVAQTDVPTGLKKTFDWASKIY